MIKARQRFRTGLVLALRQECRRESLLPDTDPAVLSGDGYARPPGTWTARGCP